ncbi:MAG: ammonium transporter, partial [Alphaproteobacteria bacterium]|nr:ammonium transporter [Alphaproteobacteria bacterium]
MTDASITLESLKALIDKQQATIDMQQSMNMESFYWWCIALMLMIHAGFLAYEMGASRSKNALAAGIKNILALAMIIPIFYLVGWWIYLSFPTGIIPISVTSALPWSTSMGPNIGEMGT